MDFLSLPTFFTPTNLSSKPHKPSPPLLPLSRKASPEPSAPNLLPGAIRRPPGPIIPRNPLNISPNPQNAPSTNPLANKLWLSSKISPPPRPPPSNETLEPKSSNPEPNPSSTTTEFQQKGKIFVGNLPQWIKKNEIAEFFRQFGPVKNVVLIKGHDDPERNVGYCFVIYGGPTAEDAAARAVEFGGVEFHGRVLTVRLDDGRRLRARAEERVRWVKGEDKREFRSNWHEERDRDCRRFRKVLETEPENWQAVVSAFERIPKV